jgi:hypothetical protein
MAVAAILVAPERREHDVEVRALADERLLPAQALCDAGFRVTVAQETLGGERGVLGVPGTDVSREEVAKRILAEEVPIAGVSRDDDAVSDAPEAEEADPVGIDSWTSQPEGPRARHAAHASVASSSM